MWRTLNQSKTERDTPTKAEARISSQLHPSRRRKKNCFLYCTPQKLARSAWKSRATGTNWPNTPGPRWLRERRHRRKEWRMYKQTATHKRAETMKVLVLICHTPRCHRTTAGQVFFFFTSGPFCAGRWRRPLCDLSLVLEHTCSFHGCTPWKHTRHNLNVLKPICLHSSFTRQLCCFE